MMRHSIFACCNSWTVSTMSPHLNWCQLSYAMLSAVFNRFSVRALIPWMTGSAVQHENKIPGGIQKLTACLHFVLLGISCLRTTLGIARNKINAKQKLSQTVFCATMFPHYK